MQISKWIVIGTLEIYAVLILLSVFLLFNIKGLRKLVQKLKLTIQGLTDELNEIKENPTHSSNDKQLYQKQVGQQLQISLGHLAKISSAPSVEDALKSSDQPEAQAVAFRAQILQTEMDAIEDNRTNWRKLYSSLNTIVRMFEQEPKSTEQAASRASGIKSLTQEIDSILKGSEDKTHGEICSELMQYKDLLKQLERNSDSAQSEHFQDTLKNWKQSANLFKKSLQKQSAEVSSSDQKQQYQQHLASFDAFMNESHVHINALENEVIRLEKELNTSKSQRKTQPDNKTTQQLMNENVALKKRLKQQQAEIDQLLAQMQLDDSL
ncbi:hypothetical protein MAH1_11930 [Sessilibacter sp. MAH1]